MMKLFFLATLFFWQNLLASQVEVKLRLSPTGQFEAKTDKILGEVTVKDGQVEAQQIKVPLSSLKTGIQLRDDHMKEKYLNVKKYPYAILHFGKGKNGQGQGELEIRGIKKPIQGRYKIVDSELMAEFPIKLSDFDISGIRYMGVGVKDEALVKVKMPVKP